MTQPSDAGSAEPSAEPETIGGVAWMTAWTAAGTFALGAGMLLLILITGQAGAYGIGGVMAILICAVGVAILVPAVVAWTAQLDPHRSDRRRVWGARIVLGLWAALTGLLILDLIGWVDMPVDASYLWVISVALLTLAALLASHPGEQHPAMAFAAMLILLIGSVAYRAWTEFDARVVALGPSIVVDSPGQVGFTATRSGDFEVRFRASSCWDGRVIANGRYEWRPGAPGSTSGATMWVELPADILPLRTGDWIRVCLRDGFAAATAAGDFRGQGGGFRPTD